MCLTKSGGESGKDCKGVVGQKDKRGRNVSLRCNTCKHFCILFVQKLGASGVSCGRGAVLMAWCSENKARCSSVLDFVHRLNNRAGSAHEKRIATV